MEILPEHNRGQNLIPQILTNNAEDFSPHGGFPQEIRI